MKLTKSQLREIIKEEMQSLNENNNVRSPTDAERKTATAFAYQKGAKLGSVSVQPKTGNIEIEISKSGKWIYIILDKRGNILDIELPF